jgi:hypothetical protein
MENGYAIIDKKGGWLVNIVVWNGDTTQWNPPEGTYAVLLSEIDINSLPKNPELDV